MAAQGITANAVHPPFTKTDRYPKRLAARAKELGVSEDEAEESFIKQFPIGRLVEPKDIAPHGAFPRVTACIGDHGPEHCCRRRLDTGHLLLGGSFICVKGPQQRRAVHLGAAIPVEGGDAFDAASITAFLQIVNNFIAGALRYFSRRLKNSRLRIVRPKEQSAGRNVLVIR